MQIKILLATLTAKFAYDPKQTLANIILLHAEQRNSNEKNCQLNTRAVINDIKRRNTCLPTNILQLFKGLPDIEEETNYATKLQDIDNETDLQNKIRMPLNNDDFDDAIPEEKHLTLEPESYSETPFFETSSNRNYNSNQENKNDAQATNANIDVEVATEIQKIKKNYEIHFFAIQFAPYGTWIRSEDKHFFLDKVKFQKKSVGFEIIALKNTAGKFDSLKKRLKCSLQ